MDSMTPHAGLERGSKVDQHRVVELSTIAQPDEDPTEKFVKWINLEGASYHDTDEFNLRKHYWEENNT